MLRYDSPFDRFPGHFELPDLLDVYPPMWRAWKHARLDRKADAEREIYQEFLDHGTVFIEQFGAWQIDGVSLADLRTVEAADAVPVTFQVWVNKILEAYFLELLNPKG